MKELKRKIDNPRVITETSTSHINYISRTNWQQTNKVIEDQDNTKNQ